MASAVEAAQSARARPKLVGFRDGGGNTKAAALAAAKGLATVRLQPLLEETIRKQDIARASFRSKPRERLASATW